MKARVLIVENDFTIAANLYSFLEMQGFEPDAAYDGHGALGLFKTGHFNAVVLDLGLPGMDGYSVLRALRLMRPAIPVLVVTARDQLDAKLAAFELGADDYMVKPFALAEVEARLRAILRRGSGVDEAPLLQYEGVAYDPSRQAVTVHGKPVALARKSLLILGLLLRAPGTVVGHRELEQALWRDHPPSSDALRSQVHLLRKKLLAAGFDGIETVYGLGWKLVQPCEAGDARPEQLHGI